MYVFENSGIEEINLKGNIFFSIFNSVKSLAPGKENVRFPDSPDFVNFLDFLTGCDVW